MLRMFEAQAPAKQTATDTITTLSGRLANATLLEDRRAAILGLRSFAKEYPASVASGALRGLIGSLSKDGEDVDTIKVVLETLLMLFSPNEESPEASDDIAMWLADEFTQRQDNITILLDLLEYHDFYSRLYALQLISSISSARPERTQECILSAPLGTTRLVATLDDPRDAVRNAGLLLLTDLTQSSTELQKLVAFESAFDRLFRLIDAEGSLSQGGIIVQDCLSLLANLVRYNNSNQSLFRETGCVAKLTELLPGGPNKKTKGRPVEDEDGWESPEKGKNIWGLLAVLRMFLVTGSVGTAPNQNAFAKSGLLQQVLDIAFSSDSAIPIRAEALYTCADMIRANPRLQEGFAQLQVALPPPPQVPNGTHSPHGNAQAQRLYVIDALLDLTLTAAPSHVFDARFAACECIKAYSYNHVQIRLHFLHRAIEGHKAGEDETPNVLTTLVEGPEGSGIGGSGGDGPLPTVDPHRVWFAAVIVFHLIYEDPEVKHILMGVSEGNEEQGEEVVTCIQALTSNLIAGMLRGADERLPIAYLMLLCGWLFEDAAAVNDFLGEGSTVRSLVDVAARPPAQQQQQQSQGQGAGAATTTLVRGLCAALLGIVYEFSTKDSPIPRRTLQPILTNSLGRERYLDALTQLRQHPLVRDFEVLSSSAAPGGGSGPGGSAPILFDPAFVDLLKDNFSRLARAIDRDPGREQAAHALAAEGGIDRDLVDNLKGTLEAQSRRLEQAEAATLDAQRRADQAVAEQRRAHEERAQEVGRLRAETEAVRRARDLEAREREREARRREEALAADKERLAADKERLAAELDAARKAHRDAETRAAAEAARLSAQLAALRADNGRLEDEAQRATAQARAAQASLGELEAKLAESQRRIAAFAETVQEVERELERNKSEAAEAAAARAKLEEVAGRDREEIRLLAGRVQDRNARVEELEGKVDRVEREKKGMEERLTTKEREVGEKEEAREKTQGELDDLLMVLGDLEEKRTRDKKRLKELGQEVSDGSDDEGDESREESDDDANEDVD
ncbi:p115 like vesicle tethering protein [Lineolata rhizophorae]|uniref:p115 like vesicle tethering protein n=1 Tax=Lineolata rhizophorae TaxID=578093 RepID=A0A6A6P4K9_9PEZI|nr:p115 like vesicle tethering protein [Lineolata rhizophorae]